MDLCPAAVLSHATDVEEISDQKHLNEFVRGESNVVCCRWMSSVPYTRKQNGTSQHFTQLSKKSCASQRVPRSELL